MATKEVKTEVKEDVIPLENRKVTIKLPIEHKNQEDAVVWVNEKRYIIKRGINVEVPFPVAQILEQRERAILKAYEFDAKAHK